MKELVEVIAKALVDRPEEVRVMEEEREDAIVLKLSVAEADMGRVIGKGGKEFQRRGGFCLETQFFPNAPANPTFPQPELRMDEVWEAETVYKLDDL